MQEELNILDYLKVIRKWRDLIIWSAAIAVFCASIYCLFAPPVYRGETSLLIPQQPGRAFESMIALSSMITGANVNIPTEMNSTSIVRTTNFIDILKSYNLAEMVTDGIRLQKYYRHGSKEGLVKTIQKKVKVKEQKGILKISVTDGNARLAADIANYYAIKLDEFNRNYNMQLAKRMGMFIQEQLAISKIGLSEAEEKLKKFETQAQLVKMSERELMLARLLRDVKVKEAIYTMLLQEYEKAKLDQAKSELFFEVLDVARIPASPSSPKPVLYAIIAGILGTLAGLFLAFFAEYLEGVGIKVSVPDIRKELEWPKVLKH
jgi:uncharacterized protein involved in exopolysaccharide biosynthesis